MTGLSVLYASQAMKDRGGADVPDRNKVSRLREVYWLKGVAPSGPKSSLKMQLYWRPDQRELGRRADLPGDGFAYVATMFPSADASFEWFEVTEVFATVPPEQINAAMKARNGIASKQPVDFDDFLGMLRKGRPSRVEQRKAADAVIAQTEMKLRKSSYRELMEQYGYGTLVVGLPLWFAVLPEDPWRAENALDDFYTRTSLGLNELKQRVLERRDCPFRRIRVTWDTTPEAWREWSRRRSAAYDDAANTSLENPIPVAKMMALFSESLDRTISKTECPDSETPSMSLLIEKKTQKTRRGRGPYPEMVVLLGQIVRERERQGDGILGKVMQRIFLALLPLLCVVRICGLGGLARWIGRRLSVSHAWKVHATRRRARILYAESRRRAEARDSHAAAGSNNPVGITA